MWMFFHAGFLDLFYILRTHRSDNRSGQCDIFLCKSHLCHRSCDHRIVCKESADHLAHLIDFFFQGHII